MAFRNIIKVMLASHDISTNLLGDEMIEGTFEAQCFMRSFGTVEDK
jgi:hypothetical protein